MRKATVLFHGKVAGELAEDEGKFGFTYDRQYIEGGFPIGFTLPIQVEPFSYDTLPPLFENLVSEGWMRSVQAREQQIDEADRFGLLLANGSDLVGAITVLPHENS